MADRTVLQIDGSTLEGVSATTLWTLHNRGTEAKRSDGVIRDPWAVTLDLIRDCAARFGGGQMMFDSIPHWFSNRTVKGFKASGRYTVPPMPFGFSADEGVALAGRIPGVAASRDIAAPPARGLFKVITWPPLDRIGLFRRIRPSITLLEFG